MSTTAKGEARRQLGAPFCATEAGWEPQLTFKRACKTPASCSEQIPPLHGSLTARSSPPSLAPRSLSSSSSSPFLFFSLPPSPFQAAFTRLAPLDSSAIMLSSRSSRNTRATALRRPHDHLRTALREPCESLAAAAQVRKQIEVRSKVVQRCRERVGELSEVQGVAERKLTVRDGADRARGSKRAGRAEPAERFLRDTFHVSDLSEKEGSINKSLFMRCVML